MAIERPIEYTKKALADDIRELLINRIQSPKIFKLVDDNLFIINRFLTTRIVKNYPDREHELIINKLWGYKQLLRQKHNEITKRSENHELVKISPSKIALELLFTLFTELNIALWDCDVLHLLFKYNLIARVFI